LNIFAGYEKLRGAALKSNLHTRSNLGSSFPKVQGGPLRSL